MFIKVYFDLGEDVQWKLLKEGVKIPVQAKAWQSRSKSGTCRTSSSTSTCISRPGRHNHGFSDDDCHHIGVGDEDGVDDEDGVGDEDGHLDFKAEHLPADPRFSIVTLGHLGLAALTAVLIYKVSK